MSVLQYPDGHTSKDVHIWNNAAFDHSHNIEDSVETNPFSTITPFDSLDSFSSKANQSPKGFKVHTNGVLEVSKANSKRGEYRGGKSNVEEIEDVEMETCDSLESFSSKENQSPKGFKNNRNGVVEVSKGNWKRGKYRGGKSNEGRDEKEIDKEIEEVEMEMNRLASRLEALRIEKAKRIVKVPEKRGKVVSAKFMEQKQNPKMEENVLMGSKSKGNRRGLSLGPVEIAAGSRRGLSLGPSEIGLGVKSKQLGRQDFSSTPVQAMQNRRKSCFWKLEDIEEEKESKGKGKVQFMRQAVTTIGSRKSVKMDDGVISSVQPKKLFGNGDKSVLSGAKKPVKQGRVVPSRYNQISSNPSSVIRKRSLPDNDIDEGKKCEKKRSLSAEKKKGTVEENKNVDTQSRVKKRWEIPSEIVIHGNYDDEKSPQSVSVMRDLLPKLRVGRCLGESPRDSGPAKKVAELVGRKAFFSSDVEMEQPVCQALSFAEDEDEE